MPQIGEEVAIARRGHGVGHGLLRVARQTDIDRVDPPGVVAAGESDRIGLRGLDVRIQGGHRSALRLAAKADAGDADAGVDFVVVEGGVDYDGEHHDGHYGPYGYEKAQSDAPASATPINSSLTQEGPDSHNR